QPKLMRLVACPFYACAGRSIKNGPVVAQPPLYNPIASKACCPPTVEAISRDPRSRDGRLSPPLSTYLSPAASGQIERHAEDPTKTRLIIYVLANARTSSLTASRCCSFLILATLRTTLSNIRSCSVICCGPSCPVS